MLQPKPAQTARKGTDHPARKGHSTRREFRGADRRAERREWREVAVIVLHPSLFVQQLEAA